MAGLKADPDQTAPRGIAAHFQNPANFLGNHVPPFALAARWEELYSAGGVAPEQVSMGGGIEAGTYDAEIGTGGAGANLARTLIPEIANRVWGKVFEISIRLTADELEPHANGLFVSGCGS